METKKIKIVYPDELEVHRGLYGFNDFTIRFIEETERLYHYGAQYKGHPITIYIQKELQTMYNPESFIPERSVRILLWDDASVGQELIRNVKLDQFRIVRVVLGNILNGMINLIENPK